MVDATTVSGARPSLRRKMLSSFQEGAMHEALHTLRKSRVGYVSAMTNACSQIDILLVDYANLVKVKFFSQLWIKRGVTSKKTLHDVKVSWTKIATKFTKSTLSTLLKKRESISMIRRLSNTQLPPPHISTDKYLMILPILE